MLIWHEITVISVWFWLSIETFNDNILSNIYKKTEIISSLIMTISRNFVDLSQFIIVIIHLKS